MKNASVVPSANALRIRSVARVASVEMLANVVRSASVVLSANALRIRSVARVASAE